MTEFSFGDAWWLDLLEVMAMGFTQFLWACVIMFGCFLFHKWLVTTYKDFFYKDEVDIIAAVFKHKNKRKLTEDQRAAALPMAVYQGLYFVGLLFLAASLQTPFG